MSLIKPKCPKCKKRDQVSENFANDWWRWFCYRCQHRFK